MRIGGTVKLFVSILFFIPLSMMVPFYAFGQFEDSRVGANVGDTGEVGLTSGYDNPDSIGDEGSDLGATGGFNVTQQGGLDGTADGQSKGSSVNILGLAMGAGFVKICTQPFQQWACPLAAMSFKDALAGRSAQQAAFQTGTYLDPSLGSTGASSFDPVYDQQALDGLQNLSEMGYTVNDDGSVSTPEGESFSAGDYASADSLMNKGLSPDLANKAMNGLASVKSAAAAKTGIPIETPGQAVASVGGAGGGGYSNSAGGDMVIEEIEYRERKKKNKRMPSSEAAKLSKNFNGDPIGIGMANLFLIVHQKYVEKKKMKTEFINREY